MTQLLIGTTKGLFSFSGAPGDNFDFGPRAFVGDAVEYVTPDPRSERLFASVTSPFYGPKIFYADELDGEWQQAQGVSLPDADQLALERIWVIVAGEANGSLYAGGDPGVLFESRDGGESWSLNESLWNHRSRSEWEPGAGGMCLHSIVPWPGDPDRLALAISAAGVFLTEDAGETWEHGNKGLVPGYLPEESREGSINLCVHDMKRAPARPERLFMQFHGGVYRSDDAGRSWTDIGDGLPSDFGFPIVVDPADPDSAFVIPLADRDRTTPDGRVRVYETRDAGTTWTARGEGLPAKHAYLTVLRQAFDSAGEGSGMELYFGAKSGDVFGSGDAGASWFTVATRLPPVLSVTSVA